MNQNEEFAEFMMRNPKVKVPSLKLSVYRGAVGSNPIASWIEDELIPGKGLFVGGAVSNAQADGLSYLP